MLASLMTIMSALSLTAGAGSLTGWACGSADASSFNPDAACQQNGATDPGQLAEALPPGAKAGECYAKVYVPPEYKTVTEPVKARGAYEEIEVTPPQYQLVVNHPPAHQRLQIDFLPKSAHGGKVTKRTEYRTASGQELPSPATTRAVYVTTAEYTEVQRTVKVRDGSTIWKRVDGDHNDGVATEPPQAEPQPPAPATDDETPGVRL